MTSFSIRMNGTASPATLARGRFWPLLRGPLLRGPLLCGPLLCGLVLCGLCACGARRSVLIRSNPAGALVRLDDEVIGTTPIDHPFVHYGTRRITVYLPGYRTWSERIPLEPHWYGRFPFDLITEVVLPLNLRDQRQVEVDLVADDGSEGDGDSAAFLKLASDLYAEDLATHPVEAATEAEPGAATGAEPGAESN